MSDDPYDLPLATLGMPIHKATDGPGLVKALCGGGGSNLAEQWKNVRCDACTALRTPSVPERPIYRPRADHRGMFVRRLARVMWEAHFHPAMADDREWDDLLPGDPLREEYLARAERAATLLAEPTMTITVTSGGDGGPGRQDVSNMVRYGEMAEQIEAIRETWKRHRRYATVVYPELVLDMDANLDDHADV